MWAVGEEALGEHNRASGMHVQVKRLVPAPSVAAAVPAATNLDRRRPAFAKLRRGKHACHYSAAPYEHSSAMSLP